MILNQKNENRCCKIWKCFNSYGSAAESFKNQILNSKKLNLVIQKLKGIL